MADDGDFLPASGGIRRHGIAAAEADVPLCGIAWARQVVREQRAEHRFPGFHRFDGCEDCDDYDGCCEAIGFDALGLPAPRVDFGGCVIAPPPEDVAEALWRQWCFALAVVELRRARTCRFRGCRRRRLCQFAFGSRCPEVDEILVSPLLTGRRRRRARVEALTAALADMAAPPPRG